MNRMTIITAAVLTGTVILYAAQNGKSTNTRKQGNRNGTEFVDVNNDGYNDNAPDHDNDGVPNGVDKDYVRGSIAQGNGNGERQENGNGEGLGNGNGWLSKNNVNGKRNRNGDTNGTGQQEESGCAACPNAETCTK